eukprot:CAMPEP_0114680244 /NCGR_PEP_ID=MMETSP0191-20121206/53887_1 /TAXON_ID=126664 /ORGANISM="Sorites sp." /LENGTH=211 /DNA_ID=CAMNT_0001956739 /DNA_START=850 /DNA_END=1486 /DNA_ORIENTATION=+
MKQATIQSKYESNIKAKQNKQIVTGISYKSDDDMSNDFIDDDIVSEPVLKHGNNNKNIDIVNELLSNDEDNESDIIAEEIENKEIEELKQTLALQSQEINQLKNTLKQKRNIDVNKAKNNNSEDDTNNTSDVDSGSDVESLLDKQEQTIKLMSQKMNNNNNNNNIEKDYKILNETYTVDEETDEVNSSSNDDMPIGQLSDEYNILQKNVLM